MNKLYLSIIARDRIVYEGEAGEVTVPTKDGVITILPRHIQLVSALSEGEVVVRGFSVGSESNEKMAEEGETKKIKIRGGVLEVRGNSQVVLLADIVFE